MKNIRKALPSEKELMKLIMLNSIISWKFELFENDIKKWLSNFKGEVFGNKYERQLALWLLVNFVYYNENEVRHLCKTLYRDFVHKILVDRNVKNSTLSNSISEFLDTSRFYYLGKPGESGAFISYLFRQVNNIPISNFISNPENLQKNIETVIFLDDVTLTGGAGSQAFNYLEKTIKKYFSKKNIILLTLIASKNAKTFLNNFGYNVISCITLENKNKCFSSNSNVFRNFPKLLEDGKKFAAHYGNQIKPLSPLGYNDGQYIFGFFIIHLIMFYQYSGLRIMDGILSLKGTIRTIGRINMLNLNDLYSNPFVEYNANVMDSNTILDYWCNPFKFLHFKISESDVYNDKMPIVFKGGRGSGKTMFLRYFSYQVQLQEAIKLYADDKNKIFNHFKEKGGIGFYIRVDNPHLKSFSDLGVSKEKWESIFTHFLELKIGREIIEVIEDLYKLNLIDHDEIDSDFVPKMAKILGRQQDLNSLNDILNDFDQKLEEVNTFRSEVSFSDISFKPSKGFISQSLSRKIPELLKKTITVFDEKINFILMINEYENFFKYQQRFVNTLIKFSSTSPTFATYRIGMRLEGFRTYYTNTKDDFIKEGRDYRETIFEEVINKDKGYHKFLKHIAQNRLEKIKLFKEKNLLDISSILGKSENLENEAKDLTIRIPDKHFKLISELSSKDKKLLRNKKNPLLELLNILWFKRGRKPNEINKAMNDYLTKEKTELSKKYKRDYVDKYKLSLTILLSSIYRKNKMYYSFNTFAFLSSGIVGHFIELCRKSFQYAEFENREMLFNEGKISKYQQDKAAKDVASTELKMTQRIENHGGFIYRFILNLGNIFRDYHIDKGIKYPETNQFTIDKDLLPSEYRDAFNATLRWSVIQRKSKLQQPSPGKHIKDIYTINRIFSPIFNITYRTRGGHSVQFKPSDVQQMMELDEFKISIKKNKETDIVNKSLQQTLDF